jgi:peptidoglycan hydrolase CwlO-like protein
MIDKLDKLQGRLEDLLKLVETLRKENHDLKAENKSHQAELTQLRQEFDTLKRTQADQSEAVKSKLTTMLSRLEELEQITE